MRQARRSQTEGDLVELAVSPRQVIKPWCSLWFEYSWVLEPTISKVITQRYHLAYIVDYGIYIVDYGIYIVGYGIYTIGL